MVSKCKNNNIELVAAVWECH